MNRFLTVALSAVESTEEVIVMETIEKVVENPGIIRTYLEGMVPNLISFVLQVVLAIVVYAIGTKMIKWVVKIVQRTMERHNVDTGVMQFLSAIVKYALYVVVVMTIFSCSSTWFGWCSNRSCFAGKPFELCRWCPDFIIKTI